MSKRLTANLTPRTWRAIPLATLIVAAMLLPATAFAAKHLNFRGRTSQNLSASFQIPNSFKGVNKFKIFWHAKCNSGGTVIAETHDVNMIPFTQITKHDTFKWTSTATYNFTGVDPNYNSNGRPVTFKVALTNTGTLSLASIDFHGTWSTHTVIVDPMTGQTVDTCNTGRVTWKAQPA